MIRLASLVTSLCVFLFSLTQPTTVYSEEIQAGAAKIDITHPDSKLVESPLYSRALIIRSAKTTVVLVTMDVVSIGEIGYIADDFLANVRRRVHAEIGIDGANILINASHCHGIPSPESETLTVQAIVKAWEKLEPVTLGVGKGTEDRIMENRRMFLKDGTEIDVRHAYSLPPNKDIAATGPIDPEIGIVLINKLNGDNLAAVYNFACHPIQGVPSGANTADITGFASQVIEDNLTPGAIALFVQGCGGDINPIAYKDIEHPRHAEPLGNRLGLSTLKGIRKIETRADDRLALFNETIELPRANLADRISQLQQQQLVLLNALGGTTLNLRQFMQLTAKHNLDPDFPSYHASRYLHDEKLGHSDLKQMDAQNRANMKAYLRNIYTMEELTRLGANLRLLKMHQQQNLDAPKRTITVETIGIRIGDFVMITFPGELTVRIGLGIKSRTEHPHTYVAGYTNGYIYYAPTAEQLRNVGGAQEDSDCILDPAWQAIFEKQATALLKKLQ
ncbi:MAG: hypothetical protein VX738_05800 [Planctomycetota bacterium]|nr:hypothetical protein [Planctomycetota bacterium]